MKIYFIFKKLKVTLKSQRHLHLEKSCIHNKMSSSKQSKFYFKYFFRTTNSSRDNCVENYNRIPCICIFNLSILYLILHHLPGFQFICHICINKFIFNTVTNFLDKTSVKFSLLNYLC